MLKFGSSTKLHKLAGYLGLKNSEVASFDLPCGYSCPMARDCKSFANRITGKITDASGNKFRCYGATLEGVYKSTRALHWNNYDEILNCKTSKEIADKIAIAIPATAKIVRIHSFGDFFSDKYFQAWLKVTEQLSDISFFGYTKVLPYVGMSKPDNFKLVYSFGGMLDNMHDNEPFSKVVRNVESAYMENLPVACQEHPADDYDYVIAQKQFALLLHGVQPKKA